MQVKYNASGTSISVKRHQQEQLRGIMQAKHANASLGVYGFIKFKCFCGSMYLYQLHSSDPSLADYQVQETSAEKLFRNNIQKVTNLNPPKSINEFFRETAYES